MKNSLTARICIGCPAGCHLTITTSDNNQFKVQGNNCPQGEKYAIAEMTDPRRIVTACVPTNSEQTPCLPVRSDAPVPRKLIPELLQKIYALKLPLPAVAGQIIVQDFQHSGINVVLTRGAEK